MRHVCGKLAPEPVALLALGHVHKKDHRACHLPGGHNGVREHLPARLVDGKKELCVRAGERRVDRVKNLLLAPRVVEQTPGLQLVPAEDLERAVVARKHMHLAVDKKKPFAHVFRDRRKLALAQLELIHLLADGAVLLTELVKKRRELRVAGQRGGVIQMNGVDGLCDALREPIRQHAAEDENDRRDP